MQLPEFYWVVPKCDSPLRFYSVLSAITGSFLAAELAGIMPERQVRPTLKSISTTACHKGSAAIVLYPIMPDIMRFIIKDKP